MKEELTLFMVCYMLIQSSETNKQKRNIFIFILVMLILIQILNAPATIEIIKGLFSMVTTVTTQIPVRGKPSETLEKLGQPAEGRQQLDEQNEIDQNNAEPNFLHVEAYLRNNDYENALKQESLGDQYMENNDFSAAIEHYTDAIQYLERAINEQDQVFHDIDINEVKNSLSLVERKKENSIYVAEFFTKYSLDEKNSANSDYLYDLEVITRECADLKMWKESTIWNYCLFNQKTTGIRRERIINDLQYTSRMWQSSDDFIHDISNQSVKAVVNDTNVNFRHEPVLENNVIRKFNLYEKVQVLQRSDFKQSIKGVNAYWYKVRSENGTEGWIFGQFGTCIPSSGLSPK